MARSDEGWTPSETLSSTSDTWYTSPVSRLRTVSGLIGLGTAALSIRVDPPPLPPLPPPLPFEPPLALPLVVAVASTGPVDEAATALATSG